MYILLWIRFVMVVYIILSCLWSDLNYICSGQIWIIYIYIYVSTNRFIRTVCKPPLQYIFHTKKIKFIIQIGPEHTYIYICIYNSNLTRTYIIQIWSQTQEHYINYHYKSNSQEYIQSIIKIINQFNININLDNRKRQQQSNTHTNYQPI